MAFDKRSNFAYSTVKVAPSPATSGTTLSVQTGDGVKFNATPPYNAVVFPSNANPLTTNAEIVRITAISTDTFTITRTQEGSLARSIVTGDQIIAGLTDKTLSDIETLLNSTTTSATTNASNITTITNELNGTSTGVTLNTPTLTLPTIADFTNATHDHSTIVKGGTLGSGIITSTNVNWTTSGAIWWQELGRSTLAATSGTITLTSFTARKYLHIIVQVLNSGGSTAPSLRFNNDTAANYAIRYSLNGSADATSLSTTSLTAGAGTSGQISTRYIELENIASNEKVCYIRESHGNTLGAATAPDRYEISGKWANTTTQISRIDVVNTGTGTFGIGSEIVILGHD